MNTHSRSTPEPVTDRTHETSWSANLEKPHHADDRDLIRRQSIDAIEKTSPGKFVNLVTHERCGHPSAYLYGTIRDRFGSRIDIETVGQCGCGGYVSYQRLKPLACRWTPVLPTRRRRTPRQ